MLLSESYKNYIKYLALSNSNENHNELLKEGRYDKITGDIVDIIWGFIKNSKKENEDSIEYQYVIPNIDIKLTVTIIRESDLDYHMSIDGSQYNNEIDIYLHLNKDTEPEFYTKLNSKLQDTVRHELEHVLQTPNTINYKRNKPSQTNPAYRKFLQDKGITHKYFTLRDETPAMVYGMYRQAKIEKRPLDIVLKEYLEYFLNNNYITQPQYDKILKTWIEFAKKNLNKAVYSKPV